MCNYLVCVDNVDVHKSVRVNVTDVYIHFRRCISYCLFLAEPVYAPAVLCICMYVCTFMCMSMCARVCVSACVCVSVCVNMYECV